MSDKNPKAEGGAPPPDAEAEKAAAQARTEAARKAKADAEAAARADADAKAKAEAHAKAEAEKAAVSALPKLRPGLVRLKAIRTCNGGGVAFYEGQVFVVNAAVADRLVKKGEAKRV